MLFSGRGTAEQNNRQNGTRLLRSRRVFILALHELVRCYIGGEKSGAHRWSPAFRKSLRYSTPKASASSRSSVSRMVLIRGRWAVSIIDLNRLFHRFNQSEGLIHRLPGGVNAVHPPDHKAEFLHFLRRGPANFICAAEHPGEHAHAIRKDDDAFRAHCPEGMGKLPFVRLMHIIYGERMGGRCGPAHCSARFPWRFPSSRRRRAPHDRCPSGRAE